MKIDAAYFDRLLAGEVDGAIFDLGQLQSFWSVRALWTDGEIRGLSPTEAVVQLASYYTGDVGNGGHTQYFLNPVGMFSRETVQALRALNELELAATLQDAIALFPDAEVSKDRVTRVAQVNALGVEDMKRLNQFDRRVSVALSDFSERVLAFLRANKDDVLVAERS